MQVRKTEQLYLGWQSSDQKVSLARMAGQFVGTFFHQSIFSLQAEYGMHHLLVEYGSLAKCIVCAECEMAPHWGRKAKLPRAEAIIDGAALKKHAAPADAERAAQQTTPSAALQLHLQNMCRVPGRIWTFANYCRT